MFSKDHELSPDHQSTVPSGCAWLREGANGKKLGHWGHTQEKDIGILPWLKHEMSPTAYMFEHFDSGRLWTFRRWDLSGECTLLGTGFGVL